MYEVVYPLGRLTQQGKTGTPRLKSLDGMTIGLLSNYKFGSELTFSILEKVLARRYPTLKFVTHEKFGDTYGPKESEVIRSLPEKLRRYECDAVISGNGG